MSRKFSALIALVSLISGFFIGKGQKKVITIHEKAKIHEKVVYRDVVKTKIVQSVKTITRPSETIVDTKETIFFSGENSQTFKSRLLVTESNVSENKAHRTWGLGVFSSFPLTPSVSSLRPVVMSPITDHIRLLISTDLSLKSIEAGVMFEF